VVDRPFTEDELRLAIRTSLTDQGWLPDALSGAERDAIVEQVARQSRAVAEALPVGAIVRRDVDDLHAHVSIR
jgi:hypothetical protein